MKDSRVLVIDDSLTARMKAKDTLERQGVTVLLARDAREGEELARCNQPDVVLLDVVLPDNDGISLCRAWRGDPLLQDIPVLLLSGTRPDSEDRAEGLRAGAMGYIAKPYQEDEMLAQVNLLYELGKTHRALHNQAQEAKLANQSKGRFLAMMSHEIRTPLTAIMGFAETILDDNISPELRHDAAAIIAKNGRHLLEVINDILDFSKIEAGKLQVELRPCSPFNVLNGVAVLMSAKAQEKGLYFRVEYETALPESITTDATRLKQILINLINNAIKFSSQGGITVKARCEPESECFCVKIQDTGIGMSPQQHAQLFQAFSQTDSSITRRFGGTGLGLIISKELSEALGGDITAESIEGVGSTFILSVATGSLQGTEMLEGPPQFEVQQSEAQTESAKGAGNFARRLVGSVLLAEDGEDNTRLIAHYLGKLGLEVTIVENGELALKKALEVEFQLILMDMQMPVMDGLTATKLLREKGYQRPIVALTANAMSHHIEECLAAGCDDHLPKPFLYSEFVETLARYCTADACQPDELDAILPEGLEEDKDVYPMLSHFVDKLPNRLSDLESAFASRDWGELKVRAHSLMGAGMYGYLSLTDIGEALESAAEKESSDAIAGLLEELKSVCERIARGKQKFAQRLGILTA